MLWPNFFLIGAAKSGTISLYHYLGQHPQIFMHPVNENCFFGLDGADFTRNFRGPVDRKYLDAHCIRDLKTYQQGFAAAQSQQILGDASPLYLYSQHAVKQIAHYTPQAKFIAILRHPADRAFSNWAHFRRAGIEPEADFQQALLAETDRLGAGWGPWPFWHYRQMGYYGRQIKRYYELFPAKNIFVCLYEDLQNDPHQLLEAIYTFLGVDASFTANTNVQHNISHQPRSQIVQQLIARPNVLKRTAKPLIPAAIRRSLRNQLHAFNTKPKQEHFQIELRWHLINEYADDIVQLQSLISRDLSHWLEV